MIHAIAAAAFAYLAAIAFYPVIGLRGPIRTAAWFVCSTCVYLSPCSVPLSLSGWRFAVSLLAITLLVKLFDLVATGPGACMSSRLHKGFHFYLAWLLNGAWLVLLKTPPPVAPGDDLRRLATTSTISAASLASMAVLFSTDFSETPFALEHVLKVTATVFAVTSATRFAAAAYRLSGGTALDPMLNPVAAATPMEFWRRWNTPTQQFLQTYVFQPAGGIQRPVRAVLTTFAVSGIVHEYVFGIAAGRLQGVQLLFFLAQGLACVVTMRLRLIGWGRLIGILLTVTFNLVTSTLFFQSVNDVVPFYANRSR